MSSKITRRSILKTSVWTAPAVTVAVAAPAMAASGVPVCQATGWFKAPGEGQNTKDYYVIVDCGSEEVTSVSIYDDVKKTWRKADILAAPMWVAKGFNDSRRNRRVLINGTTELLVSFSPLKEDRK